jgi:endoglucanase
MNEPHDMPTSLVLLNDQAAITSIRKTGATQLIAAPGNSYTGGHSWLQSSQNDEPSANYLNKLRDPINNTAIDIHEYLDYNFSGGNVECVNTFDSTMGPLTEWLRDNGLKAIVSEFGGSNTTVCAEILKGAVDYVAGHDEYIGLAAWASGPKVSPSRSDAYDPPLGC